MKIDIRKIKINKDIYPRFAPDNNTVLRYRMNVDKLPPITLAKKDNTLLDGYHRFLAHRDEGREIIEYEYEDVPESEYFIYSIKKNAMHGLQLTREEKKSACIKLYEDWLNNYKDDSPTDDELKEKKSGTANLLAVSEEKIRQWTQDIISKIKEAKKQEAWEMWLSCRTEDEIAESLKVSQNTIKNWILNKKQEIGKSLIFPESLQIYSILSIGKTRAESEYKGRLPLDVMEDILYYYTKPFDVVLDPMTGGGTTVTACKKMSRRYICYDLVGNPLNNIQQHNILDGVPKKKGFIPDIIFLDPPYWGQMKYSGHNDNLANLSLEDYYRKMENIIKESYIILRDDGIIAIIVSPTLKDGIVYDLMHRFYILCEKYKFKFIDRIIVPYSTEQYQAYDVKHAKDGKYKLRLHRDLLIFKKEK